MTQQVIFQKRFAATFPTASVLQVLTKMFDTTTNICTRGRSTRVHHLRQADGTIPINAKEEGWLLQQNRHWSYVGFPRKRGFIDGERIIPDWFLYMSEFSPTIVIVPSNILIIGAPYRSFIEKLSDAQPRCSLLSVEPNDDTIVDYHIYVFWRNVQQKAEVFQD
ncbi:uncharacterized protein TRIVIDRAFT_221508 [Trichoderma virens Gv29-8]|uniref:Uncharacterized protein n=1 Tax=Hypocrea virens (strain Gv29-8 / FGSC 10586) TaxID=413071 RepID=G9MSR2_HYPVG|nr:uncharacterized protein TRIVIDRAFT_221508 [Trichoderma virens Gv29-8]EHK22223.1 hypothetical protein TRIVIDRAFT_221508 [Trichoderma virens Gv29-8]UKZ47262.1 hypothetical protein TrVGV298_001479 [Trichoderma virens]